MLSGRNIVQVGRLVADLILRPGVGMISWVVRLNPGEAVLNWIGSFGAGQVGLHSSHEESNGFTLSSIILKSVSSIFTYGNEGSTSRGASRVASSTCGSNVQWLN